MHIKKFLGNNKVYLVERKNTEHMRSYLWTSNADVEVEEMKKSDSTNKYVHCECRRRTVFLTPESEQFSFTKKDIFAVIR